MLHSGTQTLVTPRLTLRPLTLDDAQVMYTNWASDPTVTRYLRWEPHRSWAATAEYLNELASHYPEQDFYQWGITETRTGILLGSIGIQRCEPDDGWRFATAPLGEAWDVGYAIGHKWWGHGYATEALCALRDYWFTHTDSPWLCCSHAVENVASGAVMQKAGFHYDHDATYHKYDGTAVPCRVYALLKEDWNGQFNR
ncbi:MAG: GNAT family N-acetyltransferase [Gemmiger sp.]|nr:GNAT family N-acetyltransferase [Gemmiger sp.]